MTCTTTNTTTTRRPSVPALRLASLEALDNWARVSDCRRWAEANGDTAEYERLTPVYWQAWHAYLEADRDYVMAREG